MPSQKPPNPVDIYVGKRLRFRRSMLGMSQADLGKLVNITFQQIQKYERGTNRIGASRLWEFSQNLDVSVDYFYNGFDADGQNEPDKNIFDDKETHSLIKAYYNISNKEIRQKVLHLIRAIP